MKGEVVGGGSDTPADFRAQTSAAPLKATEAIPIAPPDEANFRAQTSAAPLKLEGMTANALGKFLMTCALASDLYLPSYMMGGALTKESKLAKAAAHYKVNGKKILCGLKDRAAKRPARQQSKKGLKPGSKLTPKA